jgi:hypothetical protein
MFPFLSLRLDWSLSLQLVSGSLAAPTHPSLLTFAAMPRPNPLPDGAIKQWYGDRLMHRWQLQRFRYLEPKSALQEWLDRQKQRESRKRLAGDAYEGPSPYNDPRDPQPRADAPAVPGLWTDYRNPQLKSAAVGPAVLLELADARPSA